MKVSNKSVLINELVKVLEKDWNGKKGYLTDNEMFKYCKFYTGNFWQKLKHTNKKAA